MFSWLFDFSKLFDWIGAALIAFANLMIAGLATAAQAVIDGIGIGMPSLPSPPSALVTAESWVAWFFPVGTAVDILAFYGTAWAVWWVVSIALRWVKAES